MPRVLTRDFLAAVQDPLATLEVAGFDDGRFCLMVRLGGEALIHSNRDGSVKYYNHAEDAFEGLRRVSDRVKLVVNLANWHPRPSRKRRNAEA